MIKKNFVLIDSNLVSVPFLKSDDGKVCGMVFYSHMNGPLVGRLSVLLRFFFHFIKIDIFMCFVTHSEFNIC